MSNGQPILHPVSRWDEGRRSLVSCATTRALAGALLCLQEACCDVWQDLWSQCCDDSGVPSQSVLPLQCHGYRETTPVWVHRCASSPLCGSCRERAGRRWPKARWALRHCGQMSSRAWKAIEDDLRSVRVEGVRCPGADGSPTPTAVVGSYEGDSRVPWLWHHGGRGEGAVGPGLMQLDRVWEIPP